jgi:hypothetical protein
MVCKYHIFDIICVIYCSNKENSAKRVSCHGAFFFFKMMSHLLIHKPENIFFLNMEVWRTKSAKIFVYNP